MSETTQKLISQLLEETSTKWKEIEKKEKSLMDKLQLEEAQLREKYRKKEEENRRIFGYIIQYLQDKKVPTVTAVEDKKAISKEAEQFNLKELADALKTVEEEEKPEAEKPKKEEEKKEEKKEEIPKKEEEKKPEEKKEEKKEEEEKKEVKPKEASPEEESPKVEFKPLPDLKDVKLSTFEEEEEEYFKIRAKLFRFDDDSKQWKDRGVGECRFLRHKQNGKIRFLMRRDRTLKICANHYIAPNINIQPMAGQDRIWIFNSPQDFADEEPRPEVFAIKLGSTENATLFKEKYEECSKLNEKAFSS